jgi:transposase
MEVNMIERRTIFEIHRLANEGISNRKIARILHLDRGTVARYLNDPHPQKPVRKRASKLEPFFDNIQHLLSNYPDVSAVVLQQRLKPFGFQGGLSILRAHLRKVRPKQKESFIRFESKPGQQCQTDWGHFGNIAYGNTARRLYCLAVIECYSRLLYLEFTHSQKQEAFHRALLNAFLFFGGTPIELVHDNMLTAVLERDGPLVRFNEAFLDFLRPLKIVPAPCNVGQAHEKGKIEKGAIHYTRYNFWPLRSFRDLDDVQIQANQWRDEVANQRVHSTTGERPVERFKPESMRPLPEMLPDCRDRAFVKVHSDFSIHFDGNTYTVPPWLIGKTVTVKADHQQLTIFFKDKAVAVHKRSWHRHQRVESAYHREAAHNQRHHKWLSEDVALLMSLGEETKLYVEHLAASNQSLKKQVAKLLALKHDYGSQALTHAIQKALSHRAYGADYIENILYQEMTPKRAHAPVKLENNQALNRIRLQEPSLADYDSLVVKRRRLS